MTTSNIEEGLFNYFLGYTRANPEIVDSFKNTSWQSHAEKELDRRTHKIIETFSNEDLLAIANGDVDIDKIIGRAAESHSKA